MSLSVSQVLYRGEKADLAASVVKTLGTRLEGDIVEIVEELSVTDRRPAASRTWCAPAFMQRPGFTLRGGTTEILDGVIARGLGMR